MSFRAVVGGQTMTCGPWKRFSLKAHFWHDIHSPPLRWVPKTLHLSAATLTWSRGLAVDSITTDHVKMSTYLLLSALPSRGLRPRRPVHRRLAVRSESQSRASLWHRDTSSPLTPQKTDQYGQVSKLNTQRHCSVQLVTHTRCSRCRGFQTPAQSARKGRGDCCVGKGAAWSPAQRTTMRCSNSAITL